jgi:hypothetical protein
VHVECAVAGHPDECAVEAGAARRVGALGKVLFEAIEDEQEGLPAPGLHCMQ